MGCARTLSRPRLHEPISVGVLAVAGRFSRRADDACLPWLRPCCGTAPTASHVIVMLSAASRHKEQCASSLADRSSQAEAALPFGSAWRALDRRPRQRAPYHSRRTAARPPRYARRLVGRVSHDPKVRSQLFLKSDAFAPPGGKRGGGSVRGAPGGPRTLGTPGPSLSAERSVREFR